MADIQMRLGAQVLVMQGLPQDDLARMGFDVTPAALLNLSEPESVADAHALQRAAGADVGLSNTAGATGPALEAAGLPRALEDANGGGVRLAQQAGFPHVLAVMAGGQPLPEEEALELARAILADGGAEGADEKDAAEAGAVPARADAGRSDEEDGGARWDGRLAQAARAFAEQAEALAQAGPDAIYLAGARGLGEAAVGVAAARHATGLPVVVALSAADVADEPDGGLDPWAHAAQALEELGAAAAGVQGSTPDQVADVLARMRPACGLALVAVPDLLAADEPLPRRGTRDEELLADRAARAGEQAVRAGASLVGIGRGGDPQATGALYAHVGGLAL